MQHLEHLWQLLGAMSVADHGRPTFSGGGAAFPGAGDVLGGGAASYV